MSHNEYDKMRDKINEIADEILGIVAINELEYYKLDTWDIDEALVAAYMAGYAQRDIKHNGRNL